GARGHAPAGRPPLLPPCPRRAAPPSVGAHHHVGAVEALGEREAGVGTDPVDRTDLCGRCTEGLGELLLPLVDDGVHQGHHHRFLARKWCINPGLVRPTCRATESRDTVPSALSISRAARRMRAWVSFTTARAYHPEGWRAAAGAPRGAPARSDLR